MKRILVSVIILSLFLSSCGGKSTKKRNLDNTLYKYASFIRWSDFDAALRYLEPGKEDLQPSSFELEKLKQFKVSRYTEAPITPGKEENIILQSVEIQFYNIHNNHIKTILDHQTWEYNEGLKQWFLTSGIPQL